MELAQVLRIIRTHWVMIALGVLLGCTFGFGWALIQPKIYTADASATVIPSQASQDVGIALTYDSLAKSKVKSYIQWAKTRSVAEHAISDLKLDTTPEELVEHVEVSNPVDTAIIAVEAEASSPEAARDLATSWLEGLAQEGMAQEGASDENDQMPVMVLRVTESAALPSQPTSPNLKLAIVLGGAIGLIAGVTYAILKSLLDRRIRSTEQIEREFEVPVIGTVPIDKTLLGRERLGEDLSITIPDARRQHSPFSESMRELRTNLQFMDVDNPPRVIVVSSPLPGDGKSTVSANLALTIAAAGQRVVVVDGDLRRPTVAKTFGVIEGVGLTDVLVGDAELVDILQPWGETGNLLIMGAGKHPPNPSELLASNAMTQVLDELSKAAFVIIDAPPLIPVTDAAILAARTDGLVLVTSSGKSTVDAVDKALQNLDRVNVKPMGIILNRMPLKGPHSAYYGYGYDYRTPYADDQTTPSSKSKSRRGSREGGSSKLRLGV